MSDSRDQLVDFVAEVRKMDLVDVDEAHIVQNLQEENLEYITYSEFRQWSHGPSFGESHLQQEHLDPFGSKKDMPERFVDAKKFLHGVKVQHPCFTTSAHDIGFKKPNQVDMPVKWRGKEVSLRTAPLQIRINDHFVSQGDFTRDFEMKEPGKNAITVNNYVNRGLRTNKTFSKVHRDFDIDW